MKITEAKTNNLQTQTGPRRHNRTQGRNMKNNGSQQERRSGPRKEYYETRMKYRLKMKCI
jgi:hypothetical protein